MAAALAALTKRERQVILRFYCDLTELAIAAEVGIAVGTAKSTLACPESAARDARARTDADGRVSPND